jgi:hypothetical protein
LEQHIPSARTRVQVRSDASDACVDACAVVILTEWVRSFGYNINLDIC